MNKNLWLVLVAILLSSCGISAEQEATLVSAALTSTALSWTHTATPTITYTPTDTLTPTLTFTPTITPSPTITATPTYSFPVVTVNKQAHCRYGPAVAYLHAADLYPGDMGTVRGRFIYSKWLYVKFDKLNYFCWVAPSVVDVDGDVSLIDYQELNLKTIGSNRYGPPANVHALRNGNEVIITWDQVNMTSDDDRGYLLELFVCQNGAFLWWTDSFTDQFTTAYEVKDEAGCPVESSGLLYTVEKHGFSDPVVIPWPAP